MEQHRRLLHPLQRAQAGKDAPGGGNDAAAAAQEAQVDSKTDAENKPFKRPAELEGLPLLELGARGITRRQFAAHAARLLGGAVLGISVLSCKTKKEPRPTKAPGLGPEPGPETRVVQHSSVYFEPTEKSFPLLEVKGKPYDIGFQIGQKFAGDIRMGFELRAGWWKDLKQFAGSDPALYDTFVAAAKKHTPSVYEELRGWADGSGVPLKDLVILNLKAEYGALKDEADRKAGKPVSGCSTIVVSDGGRIILAHNEDGDSAYLEHMFMLRVSPEGSRSFLCASYPGILPGNAPWVNDAGILMTTNYIYSKEVRPGVGRYFLDRLSMEAASLEDALKICKHPERAYAFHHVIVSAGDGRAVSLEVIPSRFAQVDISGLFIHTNHLVTPELAGEAQDLKYVGTSSMTRWNVLNKWKKSVKDVSTVTKDEIMQALSSHEGKPYSPCRHPEGDITGATLLTSLFDVGERSMRIYKKQPCLGKFTDYAFPIG
jgi:hypothetical protein